MTRGQVTQRQAIVEIEISSPRNSPQLVKAVVDTGYTGHLTLPADRIRSMGLPFVGYRRGQVADGRKVLLEMYFASVTWHGQRRPVLAARTNGTALIGMSLLRGNDLRISVVDGGSVVIEHRS